MIYGRMHGAPYCGHGYVPLRCRVGGGGGEVRLNDDNSFKYIIGIGISVLLHRNTHFYIGEIYYC